MILNRYRIIKIKQKDKALGSYTSFGVKVIGTDYSIPDISINKKFVSKLCRRFNRCKLDPVHLLDVIEDSI